MKLKAAVIAIKFILKMLPIKKCNSYILFLLGCIVKCYVFMNILYSILRILRG